MINLTQISSAMSFCKPFLFFLLAVFCISCKTAPKPTTGNGLSAKGARTVPASSGQNLQVRTAMPPIPDTTFVDLRNYSADFIYDIKYATGDNFLKVKVYDCAECYLRLKTAEALIEANAEFLLKGYRIKIFDCYRPLDVQKRMWKIVSNPDYVANPAKGSIHNRGAAVDITLVDREGREVDMGTAFDHFGPEAAVDYAKFSATVKSNRKLLQETMSKHGFTVLRSEWWHFNYNGASTQKISNFKWDCD